MAFQAKADKESSSTEVKYSFFAGRWQPLHKGHLWLINEHIPPTEIGEISATSIREQMKKDGKL